MAKRVEAIVHGYVQGVSFRYYTQREANLLGVRGWVANRPDGTVQVVAEGDADSLEQLVGYLHRGSPAARVERVEADWSDATGEFHQFRVRML